MIRYKDRRRGAASTHTHSAGRRSSFGALKQRVSGDSEKENRERFNAEDGKGTQRTRRHLARRVGKISPRTHGDLSCHLSARRNNLLYGREAPKQFLYALRGNSARCAAQKSPSRPLRILCVLRV